MKILATIAAILLHLHALGTHLMGGEMHITTTSPDTTTVAMYTISNGWPGSGTSNHVTVECWKAGAQPGQWKFHSYITLQKITQHQHQGFTGINWASDALDLDSNQYRFIYKSCCWPLLNNNTNTWSDIVISADYLHTGQIGGTPYMEAPLWINMQVDSLNVMKPLWGTFNCHFVNPYADSVVFLQGDLYGASSGGGFTVQNYSPSNLWVGEDSVAFLSSTLGPVANGFEIFSYKNGVRISTQRIQWTFIVVSSTLNIEENEIQKEVLGIWDWQGRYIQKDIEGLPSNKLYLIKYSDDTYKKILLCN